MYKCKECGSIDVEVKVWYNLKSEEASLDYLNVDLENEDTYCCDCEQRADLEWVCEQCGQDPCICVKLHSPNAG